MAKTTIQELVGVFTGQNQRDKNRKVFLGTSLGLLVGATLGILFAPKSGKETRKDICDAANQGAVYVKDYATKAAELTMEKADLLRDYASEKFVDFKEAASEVGSDVERHARRLARKARIAARKSREATGNVAETVEDAGEEVKETVVSEAKAVKEAVEKA